MAQAVIATGVSAPNIRYYEQLGLIDPSWRAGNGYRVFNEAQIRQLGFIRMCRELDMSLAEVAELLHLSADSVADCAHANQVIDAHITHVKTRMAELRVLAAELKRMRLLCQAPGVGACRLMEALYERAAGQTKQATPRRTHV